MIKIGVLAEDNSDVEVIRELLQKVAKSRPFAVRSFVGHGCGKLRNKCHDWAHQLYLKGCAMLLLIHDLDRRKLPALRTDLVKALGNCSIAKHSIIIPVQELEAWLLCDANALKKTFSMKKLPKIPGNPEFINDPKEKLDALIWHCSGKTQRYMNTIHNQKIAKHVEISELKKCQAFLEFEKFIKAEMNC